jgi:hypothetical protein
MHALAERHSKKSSRTYVTRSQHHMQYHNDVDYHVSLFQVVIILDGENPLDHQVGKCLESKDGLTSVHVRYGSITTHALLCSCTSADQYVQVDRHSMPC